jgi:hypothetical protein
MHQQDAYARQILRVLLCVTTTRPLLDGDTDYGRSWMTRYGGGCTAERLCGNRANSVGIERLAVMLVGASAAWTVPHLLPEARQISSWY